MMLQEMMNQLPPPPANRRSPGIASVIGFLFGGIGLAIYFKNVVDLFFPVAVAIVAAVSLGEGGWLIGAIVAALYGFYRAHLANSSAPAQS